MRKTLMAAALVSAVLGAATVQPASARERCDCDYMTAPPAPPMPPAPPSHFQAPMPPAPPEAPEPPRGAYMFHERFGDEKVSRDDFVERAEEAFERMDRNHDGYLSDDERPRPPFPPPPPGFAPRPPR